MAAGFISFPILTRIFSVSDYGLLGLFNTTLFIALAASKLGLQESVVRFHAEYKSTNRLSTLFSTSILTTAATAALFAVVLYLITLPLFSGMHKNIKGLLLLIYILVFTRSVTGILRSFLRADQKTRLYNLIDLILRYGSLALGIFFVFFFIKGLRGFYAGQLMAAFIILMLLFNLSKKQYQVSYKNVSLDLLKQSLKYGCPLLLAEVGHLLLNYADKYLIQYYLASFSLGIYTAGYNLASYVVEAIIMPVNYALTPILMDLFTHKKENEVKALLTKSFRYFLLIMIPAVFGFIAIGDDLITLFASNKYSEARIILPYVVIGQAIYACSLILNSGLFIYKKTHILTLIIMGASLLNFGANILLIPRFGIIGAAQATLLAYSLYTIIITYFSFKQFSFKIPFYHIFRYLIVGLAMYFLLGLIHFHVHIYNVAAKTTTGAIFYTVMILLLDSDLRKAFLRILGIRSAIKTE
jgi:O-antigen/teichoic acid export membrane protein